MKKVRYGLIGFGRIAENRIVKEGFTCDKVRFTPLENAELAGVWNRSPERRAAAEALGLRWYDSLDAMLADPNIDAVFIATNNLTHAPLAIQALNAGKHVISEKPMATSSADAAQVVELAEKRGLSFAVDHMMEHNAWNKLAAETVQGGGLGAVNDCCFHMEFACGYTPDKAASWRCSKVEEMGGPVGDVASHCFYMAEFIMGKTISRVSAVYYPKVMEIKAEDGAYIKFFFADGTQGSIRCAFSELRGGAGGTVSNLGFEIYGDQAVLRSYGTLFQLSGHSDEPVKLRLELDRFDSKVQPLQPENCRNIYQGVIENHARSILNGQPLNGRAALHNLLLCEAAHASARNGGRIITVQE